MNELKAFSSELKAYNSERIYWAVEQVERVAGDIDELHLDDNLFYLKPDVDKLIEELKHQRDGAFGLANLGLTLDDLSQMAKKETDHQKYKRCVAMEKWCKYWANYWKCCEPPDCSLFIAKAKYYRKWQKRWLKIAEQFKED